VKKIYINEDYCIGCRLCEIHCLVHHSRSRKIIKAFREERQIAAPAVRVEEMGYTSFALQCRHCTDAPCLEACLTGAMYRDETTGAVLWDQDKCIGCWMCIMVCPIGAIKRGTEHRIMSKCNLCYDEGFPVCVENCPNEAIVYEER